MPKTFYNPILPNTADPWFIFKDGWYYYCCAIQEGGIFVSRSKTLSQSQDGIAAKVWQLPNLEYPFEEAWAPELHCRNDKWYIYVAARKNRDSLHQIFVLAAVTDDPQGEYVVKGTIHDKEHHWMIDGTIFDKDGETYFVWSGINDGEFKGDKNYFYGESRLYIAKMLNAWTIDEAKPLSIPEYNWEKHGPDPVNEGPQILHKDGRLFIIFSASHSFTNEYCMGLLEYTGGDILDISSWKKHPEPIFKSTKQILGPGHASFTVSPDGTEDWMAYHVSRFAGSRWKRQIHIQKFTWSKDSIPNFGIPIPATQELSVPSGEENLIENVLDTLKPLQKLRDALSLDKEDFEESVS
jgi:GH43 family beta-xylosidase